jgi:hypothetical protein
MKKIQSGILKEKKLINLCNLNKFSNKTNNIFGKINNKNLMTKFLKNNNTNNHIIHSNQFYTKINIKNFTTIENLPENPEKNIENSSSKQKEKKLSRKNNKNKQTEISMNDDTLAQSTEAFMSSINDIDSSEKEDIRSVEVFIKNFNSKIYKQNVELTNKIHELFTSDLSEKNEEINEKNSNSNSNINHAKLFVAINEINNVNLNNISRLLKLFLMEVLRRRNDGPQQDTSSSNNNTILFLFMLLTALVAYSFYYNAEKSNSRLVTKLVDSFLNPELLEHQLSLINLPLFERIQIPTSFGSTATIQNKNLILIGKRGIGKSVSLIDYCLKESSKGNIVIYADLRKGYDWSKINSDEDLLREIIIKATPNINIVKKLAKLSHQDMNVITKEFLHLIENQNIQIVFDNFNYEEDHKLLQLTHYFNLKNFKTIIASNCSLKLHFGILNSNFSNYKIKYLEINEINFKKYLVDKVNKYMKLKLEKVGADKFDAYNIMVLKDLIGSFDFFHLNEYIDSNTSIKQYVETYQDLLQKSLNCMKLNDPDQFSYLANLLIDHKPHSGYQLIGNIKNKPLKPNIENLDKFEKLGWLSVRNLVTFQLLETSLIKQVESIKKHTY